MNNQNDYIEAAQQIIASLGLPRAQQNERSALCLRAVRGDSSRRTLSATSSF